MSSRIVVDPNILGGKPCLAGHRIRVSDIAVWHERHGLTPDAIVSQVPDLTLADVHAALSYYYEHLDSVRDEILREANSAQFYEAGSESIIRDKLSQAKRVS